MLCEIFPHLKTRSFGLDRFHEIKDRLNGDLMWDLTVVIFWYHKGGITTTENYFAKDKVHLDMEGTRKLYYSIRRIVTFSYPN